MIPGMRPSALATTTAPSSAAELEVAVRVRSAHAVLDAIEVGRWPATPEVIDGVAAILDAASRWAARRRARACRVMAVPTHVGSPYYSLSDLAATLAAYGLLHLLDAQLAKPMLGNPRFAAGRARCRARWLESSLAVARIRLADLDERAHERDESRRSPMRSRLPRVA